MRSLDSATNPALEDFDPGKRLLQPRQISAHWASMILKCHDNSFQHSSIYVMNERSFIVMFRNMECQVAARN
jgi:hypothetical protein